MAVENLVSDIGGAAVGAATNAVSGVASKAVDTASGALGGGFQFPIDITGLVPASLLGAGPLLLGIVFIAFILAFRAILSVVKTVAVVAVASAAFPFVLNALGYHVAISFSTVVSFVIFGMAAFAVFSVIKIIYKIFRRRS